MAMDEALVPSAQRCPFYKAFLVTADVPDIYMQEFWATANVHQCSIRFKMDKKKHTVNLELFREMLHICPRIPGQSFAELPFEEEILDFIRFLGHSVTIRTLTDSSAILSSNLVGAIAQEECRLCFPDLGRLCISRSSRRNKVNWHYVKDAFMLSTIKLVSRHQNTQQFSALLPIGLTNEEIRNSKAYKEYYAIATGEATPKPKASARRTRSGSDTSITPLAATAIPRPTAAITPKLTAAAKGKQTAKASKAKSQSAFFEVAMTEAQQQKLATRRSMQQTLYLSVVNSTDDEGADDVGKDGDNDEEDERDDSEEGEEDDDDENKDGESDEHEYDEETREEERFDPIPQTPEDSEDEDDGEEDIGLNIGKEERYDEEEEEDELYRYVNINQGRGLQGILEVEDTHVNLTSVKPDGQQESSSVSSQFVTSMLNPTLDVGMKSIFETTSRINVETPTSVSPLPMKTPTMTCSTIATTTTTTTTSQAPILSTLILSDVIQHLPSFGLLFRFDDRLRSLEQNFSKVMQTNQFAGAVSAIPGIVQHYMDQRMNEAVQVAVQLQSDWLRKEVQRENDEFLKTDVNEQLEAEVLTRSSHSSRTSYAVAADLSKMELKKILIEKIKGNKSIQCSDAQRNLYKALVDTYEFDKIILDTYGETVTLKRRRDDDEDKDEEPSVGLDRGSKRRREGKEPESASNPSETVTKSADDQPIVQSSKHPEWFSQPQKPPSPDRDWNKTLPAVHKSIQPWISKLAKQADTRSSFNELMDTPLDFSNFIMNQLRVDTLTPELLAGPTYDLVKGLCKSLIELEYHLEEVYKGTTDQLDGVNLKVQQYPHNLLHPLPLIPDNRGRRVIPFAHFINSDLEYLRGGASSRKYTTSVTKMKATDYGHIKWIKDLGRKRQQFYSFAVNRESARDVYSKRRIIAVTKLKIVEWHSYKHLDGITVRRDDDKLYTFKEGDYKRLRIQDIEDMLLLLVQGKLTNLTVEEHFAFNVSLRMFTRSIVIQRRVEDLQLGVESYQKKLNLTKPGTYRSDLRCKEAYTAYYNLRGFIYQNKDKQNRLMRIDELHKFSDETLTDVRTTLDDRLKGIQMQYLPQTI
uniref:Uncharacterized protein n=1 Tax=Tanacetum cinerariifolium TaxID=118510 RepID=A0A6L2N9V0_TANCI|nr:hypothetical protein [Tanacetum cinerariifolium]